MFKRSRALIAGEFAEGLKENGLHNVLHLSFPPGITPGKSEDAWLILYHQWLKTSRLTAKYFGDQFLIGWFSHAWDSSSGATLHQ
tara:strand:- start:1327 stop:1581 length:255 start_codon:yes stop_codon:yes gene_type:complete